MTGPANSWSEQLDPGRPFEDASQKMERLTMEAKNMPDIHNGMDTMSDSVRVPRVPTTDMVIAGGEAQSQSIGSWGEPKLVWEAMLEAAPAADVTDEMVELALNQYYGANGWNTEAHSDAYRHDMRHALEAAFAALPRVADVRGAVLVEASTMIKLLCSGTDRRALLTDGQIELIDATLGKIAAALASRPAMDRVAAPGFLTYCDAGCAGDQHSESHQRRESVAAIDAEAT